MISGAVNAEWLDAPLRRFVQDSRVQRAIVLRPDGGVLGQFGFQSSAEVKTACALAAAINATGKELGNQLGGRPFLGLHQGGRSQGVFMGVCPAGGATGRPIEVGAVEVGAGPVGTGSGMIGADAIIPA